MFSIGIIEKNKSKKLYQWDADRYIEITASEGVEVSHVDFAYENDPKAIRREVTLSDGIMTAKVPNSLLQRCGKMRVWLVCDDVTVFGDILVVAQKARDEGYVLPDDEDDVYNYTKLEKRIEDIEKNGTGGGIAKETDPTVPAWAKEPEKPKYKTSELENDSGFVTEGTVEITSGEPTKESTVMTLNPNAEEVNLCTEEDFNAFKEEIDETVSKFSEEKANRIIETASGNPIILTDSAESEPISLEVYGKSEQTRLSGKNLFPYGDLSASAAQNIIYAQPLELSAGSYTYSMKTNVASETATTIAFLDEEKTQIKTIGLANSHWNTRGSATFEITSECKYITIYVREAIKLTQIQIEKGSVMTDYESYCGGIQSPNPEYPQKIVNAGAYDKVTGKYAVTVKATGKNLLSKIRGTMTVNGITFTNNGDGSVTANGTATADAYFPVIMAGKIPHTFQGCILNGCPDGGTTETYRLLAQYYDESGVWGANHADFGNGVNLLNNYPLIGIDILVKSGTTMSDIVFKPMIRYAEIADDTYEPYKETTVTVHLDEPLRIGDAICKKDGVWGVERYREAYITTGDEKLTLASENRYLIDLSTINLGYASPAYNVANGLCSHLIAVSVDASASVDNSFAVDNANMYFRLTAGSTEGDIRALLSQGLKIEYVLATPVFTPFEDQNIFDGLSMQYPVTVLGNDFNTDMTVKYIADTKYYIDKKFAELAAAAI